MFTINYRIKNRGVTLIEAMLVVALTLLITAAISSIYISNLHTVHTIQSITTLSTRGEQAQQLAREISQTGSVGCVKLNNGSVRAFDSYELTPANRLTGTASTFTTRHPYYKTAYLTAISDDLQKLTLTMNARFLAGDIILISDCHSAQLAKIAHLSYIDNLQRLTLTQPLHRKFPIGSAINRYQIQSFYIKNSRAKGLYFKDIHQQVYRLMPNVIAMKLRYFTKQNGKLEEIQSDVSIDGSAISFVEIALQIQVGNLIKPWFIYAPIGETT